MMKRKLTYLILAALSLSGCLAEEPGRESGNYVELVFADLRPSVELKTTIPGETALNEDRVESVDCFLYPDGETGSPAVFRVSLMLVLSMSEAKPVSRNTTCQSSDSYS